MFIIKLFSLCEFCIIASRQVVKRLLTRLSMQKTQLFQASSTDNLCIGLLLVSIANASVFFRLTYNVMDKNVTKNNIFYIEFVYVVCKIALEILYSGTAMTRLMHTACVHGPCSRTQNQQPYTHGRKIWSPMFTARIYGP